MKAALRKIGNSTGLVVPRPILGALGLTGGAFLDLTVEDGKLIATPLVSAVRAGWGEAAKAIANDADGGGDTDWVDRASEADVEWQW